MSDRCDISNRLIRDGTSQRHRQLATLLPESVKLDERTLVDFLAFAHSLGQSVNYYNDQHQLDGTWQAFFENSTPVQIALISRTPTEPVRIRYRQQLEAFLSDRSPETFVALRNTLLDLCRQMQQWYRILAPYTTLKPTIKGLGQTHLMAPLRQLQAFERAYLEQIPPPPPLPGNAPSYTQISQTFGFALGSVEADPTPWEGLPQAVRKAWDQTFQGIFQTYRQIIQLAPAALEPSLHDRQDHPPHLALYLTFVKLLLQVQQSLNAKTQQHLDFFYRQVLQLPTRPPQPDHAHVLFELTKSQQHAKLTAGTPLKAGKDAQGKDRIYRLDQDLVVDRAQIASLKGLFLDSWERARDDIPEHIRGLYLSAIANSKDGQGADFPDTDPVKAWLPFGNAQRQPAEVGLAIAAPVLLLPAGQRVIEVHLCLEGDIATIDPAALPSLFRATYSGPKDWVPASISSPEANAELRSRFPTVGQTGWDGTTLTLVIELPGDAEPMVPYHDKLPGVTFETSWPVLRLMMTIQPMDPEQQAELGQAAGSLSAYHYLRSAILTQVILRTHVAGLRNLVLKNDRSAPKADAAFMPFGAQPKPGATLYIGSPEVSQKSLTDVRLLVEWDTPPPEDWPTYYAAYGVDSTFDPGQVTIQLQRDRQWFTAGNSITLTDLTDLSWSLPDLENSDTPPTTDPDNRNWMLYLQLTGDRWLHDHYATVLSRQVLAAALTELDDDQKKRKAVIGAYYRFDPVALEAYNLQLEVSKDEDLAPPTKDECPLIRLAKIDGYYLRIFDGNGATILNQKETEFLPNVALKRKLEKVFQPLVDVRARQPATDLPFQPSKPGPIPSPGKIAPSLLQSSPLQGSPQPAPLAGNLASAAEFAQSDSAEQPMMTSAISTGIAAGKQADLIKQLVASSVANSEVVKNYELQLLAVDELQSMPVTGRKLVAIAKVSRYHLWMFDALGDTVFEAGSRDLKLDADELNDFNDHFSEPGNAEPPEPEVKETLLQTIFKGFDITPGVPDPRFKTQPAQTYWIDLNYQPLTANPPFTPVIKALTLDYSATATIGCPSPPPSTTGHLFHLQPFAGVSPVPSRPVPYCLPHFTHEGELLIGLKDLTPLMALSLLFQVAPETAATDLVRGNALNYQVQWSYLRGNTWHPFEPKQVVSDTTQGLIASGIVTLAIPADISRAGTTILDPNLHWLKVSMPAGSRTLAHIIGVYTQAAQVTFADQGNDLSHLARPIPAGSITKLLTPQSGIKTVTQPYPTFGGQPPEPAPHFYRRVSEHLRHKGRAVTPFDYERLVLENFPDIHQVRCINHGYVQPQAGESHLRQLMPGCITLAVIPDLSQPGLQSDLAPQVSSDRLIAIADYCKNLSSPWAQIQVVNPHYEPVRVSFRVKFHPPYHQDFEFYRQQLVQDITNFLAPWKTDSETDIHFGGKLALSTILNFVEEQAYVDYLVDFVLYQGTTPYVREVVASTPLSVLTSADDHDIAPISPPSSP
jgi:hypothetical protein